MSPLLLQIAQHPRIDQEVVLCSLRGTHSGYDADFETSVQRDVPLLDGYNWVEIPNIVTGSESTLLDFCNVSKFQRHSPKGQHGTGTRPPLNLLAVLSPSKC
jgi:hypothetical protein